LTVGCVCSDFYRIHVMSDEVNNFSL
jgi:hypothetical protein